MTGVEMRKWRKERSYRKRRFRVQGLRLRGGKPKRTSYHTGNGTAAECTERAQAWGEREHGG
jgi:hypothetical protein